MTMSGTTNDNKWQRVTASDTTGDNKWEQMARSGTMNEKEWKRMIASKGEWFWFQNETKYEILCF